MKRSALFCSLLGAALLWGCSKDEGSTNVQPNLNAPSGLTGTRVGRTAVQLSWKDNSNSEENFWVERSESSGPFVARIFRPANATTAVDSDGLFIDTVYQYRVCAVRYSDPRSYSDTVTIIFTLPYPRLVGQPSR